MPWKEICTVELRERLVKAMLENRTSVAALCRRVGVARKTAYKWLNRFQAEGVAGLADQSRARLTQDGASSQRVVDLIVDTRTQHPTWGAKKILPFLEREHPRMALPCLSTVSAIIAREGLAVYHKTTPRRKSVLMPGSAPAFPNQIWTIDFKGQFLLGCRASCYPLTVVDAFSRYILCIDAKTSTHTEPVRLSMMRLFKEFGVPERIRSDNGSPFASSGLGGLSKLGVYFLQLDIELERIPPGKPGYNGSHERMHRTLKAETTRPPSHSMAAQQRRFNSFRQMYNTIRPNEAIGQKTPSKLFRGSKRKYQEPAPDDDTYPGHWERRNVKKTGCITWRSERVYISEALAGRTIGLVEVEEDIWQLNYRKHLIATLDNRTKEPVVTDLFRQRQIS